MENQIGDVFKSLHAITAEIGAIGKTNKNSFQNYNFRSIGQAMAALQPLLVKHNLVLQPSFTNFQVLEQEKGSGMVVMLALGFYSTTDGSSFVVRSVGQGADSGDKAAYKAMAGALKYAIFSTFCVPEEGADAEFSEPEVKMKKPTSSATARNILG